MKARQICIRIIHKMKLIMLVHDSKRPATNLQYQRLELLGMTRKHIKFKPGSWHRWEAPEASMYKLNIDGSARDNNITGGGVIRDYTGRIIAGFLNNYGAGTNTRAEFLALLDGLALCASLHHAILWLFYLAYQLSLVQVPLLMKTRILGDSIHHHLHPKQSFFLNMRSLQSQNYHYFAHDITNMSTHFHAFL